MPAVKNGQRIVYVGLALCVREKGILVGSHVMIYRLSCALKPAIYVVGINLIAFSTHIFYIEKCE